MRNTTENLSALQSRMNGLQLENQVLKQLLEQNGISYRREIQALHAPEKLEKYETDQGARIRHPQMITDVMANHFYARFWGRQDVYSQRSENKRGEAGYYPQCHNFWRENCPKAHGEKISCGSCPARDYKRLHKEDILAHLRGYSSNGSDVIGVYPLLPDGTCRFLVYDFDDHEKGAEKRDFANSDDSWIEEVEAMRTICVLNGLDPLVERSRSGQGAHIWLFFDKPISARLVRAFGNALLDRGAEQVNLKSFRYYDRMLPAQEEVPEGGLGNLIALPLQGRALREGNSAFVDENWNAYPDQWKVLWSKPRLSEEFLQLKLKEWAAERPEDVLEERLTDVPADREKPWKWKREFSPQDVAGTLSFTLADGIYVDTLNLKPAMQNRIRRLAAVSNPGFYRNQAIGISNYFAGRWIYLGQDHLNGYLEIPRGLYDELTEMADRAGISWEAEDERNSGRSIQVSFRGELRQEQKTALEELLKYENGILHAATAFGKTVVCCALIAARKVNTLVILESSSLISQWEEAFANFLEIQEPLPVYQTKSGRTKTRKSLTGYLQGPHDSLTGIVDIAMAGSLCRKGELHSLFNQYGLVIVDECHHAASETVSNVLRRTAAKYIYGVTATPMRSDGLEKVNYMLLGPVRYQYTAKDKAKAQGIAHFVYPRFTRAVVPKWTDGERMHPNEAYEIIRNHDVRDDQIIEDVKACVEAGRTPIVLSRYKDHSEKLYQRLMEYADHVFLLTGNHSKREHRAIREQMQAVRSEESLILVATGSLVGEGFDFPRLDTLIMATPVSFRSVVEQYAGRLNRDYQGKQQVIIYDYIDSHILMFRKMYMKRLKAYKQIGYEICGDLKSESQMSEGQISEDQIFAGQKRNTIFDGGNYQETLKADLLSAAKNIIISSPAISGQKVYELIALLKERQETGVDVTIITWAPDSYGYGEPSYWMQLHEDMRQAGRLLRIQSEQRHKKSGATTPCGYVTPSKTANRFQFF